MTGVDIGSWIVALTGLVVAVLTAMRHRVQDRRKADREEVELWRTELKEAQRRLENCELERVQLLKDAARRLAQRRR